ncbi:adenylyl-sulfate kinase [Psychroflexus sp. YR1-1]|uniref:Adenylyl-sulfate kinase n=1 Tax=Psychroflexus aurantiacus TaxID=2709310 RepID=A0A6B3R1I9_9FLAO|nr:adenylyl-sulfate kinase [Psychroflexus aurantiacus]NEV94463.1 adenylyl-sulfate kinase [Psychroflexus aurantiacus]
MSENIVLHDYDISRSQRNKVNGHESFVLWFTGLSGSGKSTIANKVEEELFYKGITTYALDGDNIRSGINKGLGFTKEDRLENLRRIAEVAKLFVDAGVVTLAAFVSPLISDREQVKQIVGENDIIEVFVDTPLEECERRDVKGLYKKARAGEIKNFTGIDAPYEAPKNPEIHIKTKQTKVEEAVQIVINYLEETHRI